MFVAPEKTDLLACIDFKQANFQIYRIFLRVVDAFYANEIESELDEALFDSDVVLNFTWERLNTGNWKDVPIVWRKIYSATSIMKALILDALLACDMGLLMGAPILDDYLPELASQLHEKVTQTSVKPSTSSTTTENDESPPKKRQKLRINVPKVLHEIPEEMQLSLQKFHQNYLLPQQPVKILHSMDHWPAVTQWDIDYIRKVAGFRTVPVEIGSKYTDEDWGQQLMTIHEFITKFIENQELEAGPVGYLAQHSLFDQILELSNDITTPEYCFMHENAGDIDINAWFGPGGTVSPMHFDPRENILTQIFGSKYVRLYSPKYSELLYPNAEGLMTNTSQVDVENADLEQFPRFTEAPYVECVLNAAEMLYIPPKWWHYVRSLEPSFSVSFWFG